MYRKKRHPLCVSDGQIREFTFRNENGPSPMMRSGGRIPEYPDGGPLPGFERRAGLLEGMDLAENIPYTQNGVSGRLKTFTTPWAKYFTPSSRQAAGDAITTDTFDRGVYNAWQQSYRGGTDPVPDNFLSSLPQYQQARKAFRNPNIQSVSVGSVDFSRIPKININGQQSYHEPGRYDGVYQQTAFFADPDMNLSHLDRIPSVVPKVGQPRFRDFAKKPVRGVKYSGGNDPFRHYTSSHRRRMGYYAAGGMMGTDYDLPTGRPPLI